MRKTKYMSLKDFTRPTNAVKNFSEPLPKSNYEIHTPNAPLSPKKRTIREVAKEIVEDWILTGYSLARAFRMLHRIWKQCSA